MATVTITKEVCDKFDSRIAKGRLKVSIAWEDYDNPAQNETREFGPFVFSHQAKNTTIKAIERATGKPKKRTGTA
jgi:hypothetical protein